MGQDSTALAQDQAVGRGRIVGDRCRIDDRPCFGGILLVLRSGARWKDLPARYPSPGTCWRRLRGWQERDVRLTIWRTLLGELDAPAG